MERSAPEREERRELCSEIYSVSLSVVMREKGCCVPLDGISTLFSPCCFSVFVARSEMEWDGQRWPELLCVGNITTWCREREQLLLFRLYPLSTLRTRSCSVVGCKGNIFMSKPTNLLWTRLSFVLISLSLPPPPLSLSYFFPFLCLVLLSVWAGTC